jgi:hypothetical protein
LDRTTRWTIDRLGEWYGAQLDPSQAAQKLDIEIPAGRAYLHSENHHVRMVGSGAAGQEGARWLAADVVGELDSSRLIERQFAQQAIETLLEVDLEEATGYRFWMTPAERAAVLAKVRDFVTERTPPLASP